MSKISLWWGSIKEAPRQCSLAFQADCKLQSRRSASSFSPIYWSCLVQAWPCEILHCSFLPWQNSLTRRAPIPSDAQGRSGARFHTSYNKRYVIKIITSEDVAEMHNILKKYHQVKGSIYFFVKIILRGVSQALKWIFSFFFFFALAQCSI